LFDRPKTTVGCSANGRRRRYIFGHSVRVFDVPGKYIDFPKPPPPSGLYFYYKLQETRVFKIFFILKIDRSLEQDVL